jgi:hypothetical protein
VRVSCRLDNGPQSDTIDGVFSKAADLVVETRQRARRLLIDVTEGLARQLFELLIGGLE